MLKQRLSALAAAAFVGFCCPAEAVVTIAVTEPCSVLETVCAEEKTLEYLRKAIPDQEIQLVRLSNVDVRPLIKTTRPDFMISSSSTYLQAAWSLGAHRIVHKRTADTADIQHAVASLFIVRADDQASNLASLKNRSAAAYSESGFEDWIIARGEIEAKGFDSRTFFKRTMFSDRTGVDVIDALRTHAVDVGVLPACVFEKLQSAGKIRPSEFRAVGEYRTDGESCRRSTEAYPDVVFSSMPWADAATVKSFMVALLELPQSEYGFEWSTAHDLNPVLNLMKTLRLPPFEYLNDRTLSGLIRKYRVEIGFFMLMLGFILFHTVRANILVARRTRELTATMEEREKLAAEMANYKEKLSDLERMGIVSYMSNLFAHEIRQPITNVLFYSSTLDVLTRSRKFDEEQFLGIIEKITGQAERANEIVRRLRDYAKNPEKRDQSAELKSAVDRVLSSAVPAQARAFVRSSVPQGLSMNIDPFELEFIISAFVKNALDSLRGAAAPSVAISASRSQEGMLELSVSDNGPQINAETFAKLGRYTVSTKENGLGFGLAVASDIAERRSGHLQFRKREPSGLIATLILPEGKNT